MSESKFEPEGDADAPLKAELTVLRAENSILKENDRIREHLTGLLEEYPRHEYRLLLKEIEFVEEYLAALREGNHDRLLTAANIVRQGCASTLTNSNPSKQERLDGKKLGEGRQDETNDSEDYPTIGTFAQLGVLSEVYIEDLLRGRRL
jgi:hypothetical protein